VGLMFGMVISLLLVPVLYAQVMKPSDKPSALDTNAGQAETPINPRPVAMLIFTVLFLFPLNGNAGKGLEKNNPEKLTLEKVIDLAVQNNRMLTIRRMQVDEKQQKVNEDRVKFFPSVILGGAYLYNDTTPVLNVSRGAFGELPMGATNVPMPPTDKNFELVAHELYGASAILYQPISQIPKISAGVNVAKTELDIARMEQAKATLQIQQNAEKLYIGLLILEKQKEEAQIKLLLAQRKLYDVESAVLAGKATRSSETGLRANVADEEQNLLKINIQMDDYTADLKRLTGLPRATALILDPVSFKEQPVDDEQLDDKISEAQKNNHDLKMAVLYKTKAEHAFRASRYSYLPDVGAVGGYTYQDGITLYPENNSFVGVLMKWNLQDILSNTYVFKQRLALKKQAEENLAYTLEQVRTDIEKAHRKLTQTAELIRVAKKVLDFRAEDLKIQTDRNQAGLNLEADVLSARAAVAKAESDYYAARLNHRIAATDLRILTGKY